MELTNSKIKQFLEVTLNKNYNQITNEDLQKVECVGINSEGQKPADVEKDFEEVIKNCPNLKMISFRNTYITEKMQQTMKDKNIESMYLETCAFSNEEQITLPTSVVSFEMRKSFMDNYDGLIEALPQTLKKFAISFPEDETKIDGSKLSKLSNVEFLVLEGCIIDFSGLHLDKCKVIDVLNTEIKPSDITTFSTFQSLEEIYISSKFNAIPELDILQQKCKIKNDLMEFAFEPEDEEEAQKNNIL